jgi:type I restriction enzyme S subunit
LRQLSDADRTGGRPSIHRSTSDSNHPTRPPPKSRLRGNRPSRLYTDQFGVLRAPFPPVEEQATIVEYLNEATNDVDTATNRAKREIELLNEYRTRIIADVVTGKLDVREAAAALPELDPLDVEGDILDSETETDLDAIPEEAEA